MSSAHVERITLGQRLAAGSYIVFCAVLKILDIRIVAIFGRCIGYLAWALMPRRRKIVARNLRIVVDPTLHGKKLSALVRRNIVRTCMNMACTFKTGVMTDKELERSVNVIGADTFVQCAQNGHTVISCIPHAGNWEILARIRPLFPNVKRFGSMYRKLDNPVLEDFVYKSRTRFGCEMFSSQRGLKEVFRLAKEGGMLGVLSDQFTQQGLFLPYFGKVTGTTSLPSLIFKRCRGNGHLMAVTTRNTGLGKWDAVLNIEIPTSGESTNTEELTLAVNQALEKAQNESILDGFWMHHRWKATCRFAPEITDTIRELITKNFTLPFRILICVPEPIEEAILTIPFMREMRACRPDIQLNIICPAAQQAFWKTQNYVAHVVTNVDTVRQLEADELHKDGPYDYLFMLSEDKSLFRKLQKFTPLYNSGFADSPFSKKLRTRCVLPVGANPIHKSRHYQILAEQHIQLTGAPYADAACGNQENDKVYLSPYSTLGEADSWPTENWKHLVQKLASAPEILAFPEHREKAEKLAIELGIKCNIIKPEQAASILGPKTRLFTVDGLMPQLAALVGCRCNVIMASRLAAVYAPLGKGHHVVSNHVPCHPCYQTACDQAQACAHQISVDEFYTA